MNTVLRHVTKEDRCTLRKFRVVAIVFLSVFLLPACSLLGSKPSPFERAEELVAVDLTNALMQIEKMHPQLTTVRTPKPGSPFGKALGRVMRSAGYTVQQSSDKRAKNYLSYSVTRDNKPQQETHSTYQINISNIRLKRSYKYRDNLIEPASSLYVDGVDPGNLVLNDAIFTMQYAGTDAESGLINSTLQTPSDPRGSRLKKVDVKKNVAEIGGSNFRSIFKEYTDQQTHVLIFANNSVKLGKSNKKVIQKIVNEFNASTDVISVVGCSNGKSKDVSANARLAQGRAEQVKEAFLVAGIDRQNILDEACWSPQAVAGLPSRGVVVALKRSAEL